MYFIRASVLSILLIPAIFFFGCRDGGGALPLNSEISAPGYRLDSVWPRLPAGFLLGNPTGMAIDAHGHLFVFHRAERKWPDNNVMPREFISSPTILMLDMESGTLLRSWGTNMFIMPHGLSVDHQGNVWVTDVGLHQVFKFTHDGELVMKLGEAFVPGNDSSHFNLPTDIAITRSGSFYVSDGYGNSRVVKFSPEGKYLLAWGRKGDGEAEFNIPHGISLDREENVYVADRENRRIQEFDPGGKFIREWKDDNLGRICSVVADTMRNQVVAVDDALRWFGTRHKGSNIIITDTGLAILQVFGRKDFYAKKMLTWFHDLTLDPAGNIYVGDILGNRIFKYRKVNP